MRNWEFRQLPAVHRCSRPTRPDKARKVGYKAFQGYCIYRVRVKRGDRKKRVAKGIVYGKPVNQGINKWKAVRNLRSIAEERVGRKCGGLRVLNSYWDAMHKWYEVIMVDPFHSAIRNDPRINWTAGRRKARGLLKKGKRATKLRPSARAVYRRHSLMRLQRRRRTLTSPDDDDGNGDAKEVDKAQKSNSSFEEETAITKVLKSVDPSLLDDSPGGVNALTRKGTILMTMCSCLGFHALRLILRDAFFRSASSTRPNTLLKRKAIHAFGCSYFSLRKFLSGRWNSPVGSEAMLCFSLGCSAAHRYTSYTLCALKTQLLSDPLWALNELGNFVKIWSCLRAQGVGWVVPMLFSAEVPTAFLDTLRMLAEFGIQPSHIVWRMFLGAFTLSFVSVKAIALPAILGYFVLRPQDYPELHQPAFLPAKLAILARAFLNYLWLSIVARHWVPTRHFHPEGEYLISRREERLPRLREITPNMGQVIQHIRKAHLRIVLENAFCSLLFQAFCPQRFPRGSAGRPTIQ
eukprot:g12852.t1